MKLFVLNGLGQLLQDSLIFWQEGFTKGVGRVMDYQVQGLHGIKWSKIAKNKVIKISLHICSISLHFSEFLCISLHFSEFLYIFSEFLCISG